MATSRKDIGPDGLNSRKDVEPDGHIKQNLVDEADVEGHSMMLNPTLGRDLAKAKSAEVERGVRAKNNESEIKRIFRR